MIHAAFLPFTKHGMHTVATVYIYTHFDDSSSFFEIIRLKIGAHNSMTGSSNLTAGNRQVYNTMEYLIYRQGQAIINGHRQYKLNVH